MSILTHAGISRRSTVHFLRDIPGVPGTLGNLAFPPHTTLDRSKLHSYHVPYRRPFCPLQLHTFVMPGISDAEEYLDVLSMPIFSEDDVLRYGLDIATGRCNFSNNDRTFRALYGSSAKVLAEQFEDLQASTDVNVRLTRKENSSKGLRSFLMAHHWLWAAPKNVSLMATRFRVCEDYCQGEYRWKWVRKIAALAEVKIRLEDRFSGGQLSVDYKVFTLSLDGTDFRCWEPKHPTKPIDTGYASHKFKSAGLRYEVAISIETGKCLWISGPHSAGKHNMTIL